MRRPPWVPQAGDRWIEVENAEEAVRALAGNPRRVFLALGRKQLAPFPAKWAGTDAGLPLNGLQRKFGVFVPTNPGYVWCENYSEDIDAQQVATVPQVKLVRKLGDLPPHQLALVEATVQRWLGL